MNRIVEWTTDGIAYESDQRHAELVIRGRQSSDESKHVSTPGTKHDTPQHDDEDELSGRM